MLLALTIACFMTANPSPWEFVVGGPKADVEAVRASVSRSPGARVLDHAAGADWGFAHVEVNRDMRYGDFMGLMNEMGARRLRYSPVTPVVPACEPDGRAEEIEVSWAPPVIVGVFGDAASLRALRQVVTWAEISDLELPEGRRGVMFRPRQADETRYVTFVRDVRAGRFGAAEVVLLEEAR